MERTSTTGKAWWSNIMAGLSHRRPYVPVAQPAVSARIRALRAAPRAGPEIWSRLGGGFFISLFCPRANF